MMRNYTPTPEQIRRASQAAWRGRKAPDIDTSTLPPAKDRTPEQRRAYARQKHREWRARLKAGIKPRVNRPTGLDRKGMTHAEYIKALRKLRPLTSEQRQAAYKKFRAKLLADPARLALYRAKQRARRLKEKLGPVEMGPDPVSLALASWNSLAPPQCEP